MNRFTPSITLILKQRTELPEETPVFVFHGRDVLVRNETELPTLGELPQFPAAELVVPGTADGKICAGLQAEIQVSGYDFQPVRFVFKELAPELAEAGARAKNLIFWRNGHRFCGVCGRELTPGENDMALVCPECGQRYYPQIAPAVITAVTHPDGKILLAHNRNFRNGIHSLIAGFVEAGENLEQAVAREIFEETAIRVKNIRYFSSQSWPFPNSLMVGFLADYDSGELHPDGTELDHADWYSFDALPTLPEPGSIARRIIDELATRAKSL